MKFSPSVVCVIAAVYLGGPQVDAQVFAPGTHGALTISKPANAEVKANEALNSNKMTTSPLRSRYLQTGSSSGGFLSAILEAICGIIRFFTFGLLSFCSDGDGGLGSGVDGSVPVCEPPLL